MLLRIVHHLAGYAPFDIVATAVIDGQRTGVVSAAAHALHIPAPCHIAWPNICHTLDLYISVRIFAIMTIKIDSMQNAADRACDLLKAMANRHRLLILCQLIQRERSVGELAALLGIRDSGVSQHLTLLRKDGLVSTRREGQTIWYSIASLEAKTVISTLDRLFCSPSRGTSAKARAPRPARGRP